MFNPSINLLGRRNIKISKCELDINFKESDELMLVSKYPISARQALEGGYKPKTVTITNNSTCDTAYYKLTIKDLINSSINKDIIQYHVVDKQNTMTYKLGDVNGDGEFNSTDRMIIVRYFSDFKFKKFNYNIKAADVTGDGKINDDDKILIQQYFATSDSVVFPAGDPLTEKTTTKEIIDVNPDTFLIENSLEKGQTHEYEIMMWISNVATNTDLYVNGDTTKPIEYKYALNIEAYDEKPFVPVTATEFVQANVGQNGLEEVIHEIDDTLQVDSKFATEYRYRGGNVSNYVTFNNEVWRIIGVIPTEDTDGNVENRFKIIKDTSIGGYNWDSDTAIAYNYNKDKSQIRMLNNYSVTSSDINNLIDYNTDYDIIKTVPDIGCTNCGNNWARPSVLNNYLNETYYNTLTSDAQKMIGTAKYYLGGYNTSRITSDVMWQYERKNEANRTDYYYEANPIMQNDANKKIAIMYASDYGYAASKECTNSLYDYGKSANCITTNNWLDKSVSTWLLPQYSSYYSNAFFVHASGYIDFSGGIYAAEFVVLPVLTLSSNVKISSGTGTSSEPYQLTLE